MFILVLTPFQKKLVPKDLQNEFNQAEEALVFEKFLPSHMFGNGPAKTDNQRLQMDKVCISAMLELRAAAKYISSLSRASLVSIYYISHFT